MNRISSVAVLCLMALAASACHRTASAPVHVALCDLYRNPSAYDGKTITLTATVTQLPNGKYLYPGSSSECNYSFIKVDASQVLNSALTELESSSASSPARKEFDLEVTGTFDAPYSESWDAFRGRIVSIEIKPRSPVRTGKPLGAA
jgi:hypothetical protein